MARRKKKKEKIEIKIRRYDRKTPKHNYLKHWRVVRYWVKRKYDLSDADLDMILFLYDENLFTYEDFEHFKSITSWDRHRFFRLKKNGWIHVWKDKNWREGNAAMYELTFKSRQLCARVYKLLNGEIDFPESPRRNPVFKRKKYTDKVYSIHMAEINKANRLRRQRQILG